MDLYCMERLIELQRAERDNRLAQAVTLREVRVAVVGGAILRRRLAVVLIALATRLAPSVAAADARAPRAGLSVTTR